MSRLRILAVTWGLATIAPRTAIPCEYAPDMPSRIYSLRDVGLSSARYAELASEWGRYVESHPRSALALVNWVRARNYARDKETTDRLELLQRAVRLDPDCPEALVELANEEFGLSLQSGKPTMDAVRARLERAVELAPEWPTPHFYLFNVDLLFGDAAAVSRQMELLVRKRGFSAPLLDFAYNLLSSADPGAIVLTNGDNDTYPTLAMQSVFGVRKDVRVVNLSLLNLMRYAKGVWASSPSAPAPLTEQEILRHKRDAGDEYADGPSIVAALMQKIAGGEWTTPVYFATTVPQSYIDSVCRQALQREGLLYRVLPTVASVPSDGWPIALAKTDSLLTQVYRLESSTDFSYAWDPESSPGQMMWNYFGLWYRVATGYAESGDLEGVRRMLRPAVAWLRFHPELRRARDEDPLPKLLAYWRELDPENPEVQRLQQEIDR